MKFSITTQPGRPGPARLGSIDSNTSIRRPPALRIASTFPQILKKKNPGNCFSFFEGRATYKNLRGERAGRRRSIEDCAEHEGGQSDPAHRRARRHCRRRQGIACSSEHPLFLFLHFILFSMNRKHLSNLLQLH